MVVGVPERNSSTMNAQMTLRRRSIALVAALLALMLSLFGVASAATAHGGDIQLNIGQDGTGKIMMDAVYLEDGHQVEEVMDAYMTAVSATGQEVGPIRLVSGEFGPYTWATPDPALLEGQWSVTVTTTRPAAATSTVDIDIVQVETVEDTNLPGYQAPTGLEWMLPVGIAVAGAILIALIVIIIVRMRSKRSAT
jgi:hypothetical protein